jgi:hypothetical protein
MNVCQHNVDAISHADGGDGGWIGALINGIAQLGTAGIALGGTANTNKAAVEQARINAQAAVSQSGWASVGNSAAANQLLYAALGNKANTPPKEPNNNTLIVLGLVGAALVVAVLFIFKSDN